MVNDAVSAVAAIQMSDSISKSHPDNKSEPQHGPEIEQVSAPSRDVTFRPKNLNISPVQFKQADGQYSPKLAVLGAS